MKVIHYLRFCLGVERESQAPDKNEWKNIYDFCLKQSLLGIGYDGLEKLSNSYSIETNIKYQWIGDANQVILRNKLLNQRCIELQEMFAEDGFATIILKGQGNALMYPNPLLRQPGDIDIWVLSKDRNKKFGVNRILEFLNSKIDIKKQIIGYHHVVFPIFDDVEVEVHWRPSWRSSPLYNNRLQKWFRNHSGYTEIKELPDRKGKIIVPSWEFNVIFQLQHMFLHIFQEGLGLRQVLDYYYLLRSSEKLEMRNEELEMTLKHLGLWKFAGAVMYVLREVFLLEEQYLIAPVDERRGKHMLSEILQSGNFGQYDERNKSLHQKSGIARSLARAKRQLHFLRDYPHETLCAPYQIYHVIWRKLKLWRWEDIFFWI